MGRTSTRRRAARASDHVSAGLSIAAALLFAMFGSAAVGAAASWSEVWAPDSGFTVEFPAPPTFATRPMDDGSSERRQEYWALQHGGRMFVVTVVDMPAAALPAVPTIDYYGRLIERYAAGSRAMMREDYPETVAGYPGAEAILDDWTDDVHHLVDVVLVGTRLYMIGSAGPKGHETGPDAIRFRDSFRITVPSAAPPDSGTTIPGPQITDPVGDVGEPREDGG